MLLNVLLLWLILPNILIYQIIALALWPHRVLEVCAHVKQLITQRALELCGCCLYLTDSRRAVVWCSHGSRSNFTAYYSEFTEPRGVTLICSHIVSTNRKPDLGHLRYRILQRKNIWQICQMRMCVLEFCLYFFGRKSLPFDFLIGK